MGADTGEEADGARRCCGGWAHGESGATFSSDVSAEAGDEGSSSAEPRLAHGLGAEADPDEGVEVGPDDGAEDPDGDPEADPDEGVEAGPDDGAGGWAGTGGGGPGWGGIAWDGIDGGGTGGGTETDVTGRGGGVSCGTGRPPCTGAPATVASSSSGGQNGSTSRSGVAPLLEPGT